MRWRALAPGKVNLCLYLGEIRPDGRHELVTLFESVSLADELELTVLSDGPDQVVCPGVEGPNLVTAALAGLRARGWSGPPVRIEVSKWIPVAGGMGGGSADAGAAIRLARALAPIDDGEAAALAAELGSDVPSQLAPGLALGTGAGDLVEPVEELGRHAYVVVPMQTALPTSEVYEEADRLGLGRSAEDLERRRQILLSALQPGERLPADLVKNDLEPAAISLRPAIGRAIETARHVGADQAFVCGSGPTVAAVFWGDYARERAQNAEAHMAGRYPEAYSVAPVDATFGAPERC